MIVDTITDVSFDLVQLAVDIEQKDPRTSERIMDLTEKLWQLLLNEPVSQHCANNQFIKILENPNPKTLERIKTVLYKCKYKDN